MEVMQNNMVVAILGKGDLVGSDISVHLLTTSNFQGSGSQHNSGNSQDVVVKSSSDVKVSGLFCFVTFDCLLTKKLGCSFKC